MTVTEYAALAGTATVLIIGTTAAAIAALVRQHREQVAMPSWYPTSPPPLDGGRGERWRAMVDGVLAGVRDVAWLVAYRDHAHVEDEPSPDPEPYHGRHRREDIAGKTGAYSLVVRRELVGAEAVAA